MAELTIGEIVGVPCQISSGAFPDEKFISLESAQDVITGFVNERILQTSDGNKGYVFGIVQEIGEETVKVWIEGSFFNTSGLTKFDLVWANSNLRQT